MEMELGCIRAGVEMTVTKIPAGTMGERLRQFGLVEGLAVRCRYARRNLIALEWPGTAVAVRRGDLKGFEARVVSWEN